MVKSCHLYMGFVVMNLIYTYIKKVSYNTEKQNSLCACLFLMNKYVFSLKSLNVGRVLQTHGREFHRC